MTLAFTADLHLPITDATAIAGLAREVAECRPRAFVIAGDIGESLPHIEQCLATVKGLVDCPVLVLAGNHDLWVPQGLAGNSDKIFREELPRVVAEAGCEWLEGKAVVFDGVAVAGTIAWYDYSAADPAIPATKKIFAEDKRYFNNDAFRIQWRHTDESFCQAVAGPFLTTLDRLEADPAVRQVVVATHVPLLECQMCRKPGDVTWGFSNAYFGNLTLGQEVLKRRKVTHIISGHTHVGREGLVNRDGGTVDARVIDSQYGNPVWIGLEFAG